MDTLFSENSEDLSKSSRTDPRREGFAAVSRRNPGLKQCEICPSGGWHFGLLMESADGEGFDSIDVTACRSNDLQQSADSFGTESGTVGGETGTFPPDLRAVVDVWPALSDAQRKAVLAIVEGATEEAGG